MSITYNPFTRNLDFVGAAATGGGGGSGITQLTGDVSATGPGVATATVNAVGGQLAGAVAAAAVAVSNATSLNTPSTLVMRDASGNFSANTITASLTGHASLDELFITPAATTTYFRGDKTFQTLNTDVVPEGSTNKYLTFPLYAPDGSALVPPYNFSNEPGGDTGMFRVTGVDGHIGWSSQGAKVMELAPGGDLEINGTFTAGANINALGNISATGDISAANYPPVGSSLTFAGFDAFGDLFSQTAWNINPPTSGVNFSVFLSDTNPGSGETHYINDFQAQLTPTDDLTNINYIAQRIRMELVGPNAFSNNTALNLQMNLSESGDKGNNTLISDGFTLGDGITTSSSQSATVHNTFAYVYNDHTIANGFIGDATYLQVGPSGTVGYMNVTSKFAQVDGTVTGGSVNIYNSGIGLTSPQPVGVGLQVFNSNISTSASAQFYNGFSLNGGIDYPTEFANGCTMYSESHNIASGVAISSWTSFAANSNFQTGSVLNGSYLGLSMGPALACSMGNNGFFGVQIGPQFYSDLGNITGYTFGATLNDGTVVQNGIIGFQDQTNINAVTGGYYSSIGSFPNFGPLTNIQNATCLNVNPTWQSIYGNSLTLCQLNASSNVTGTIPQITALNINLSQINSPNKKMAINSSDGSHNMYYQYKTSLLTPSIAEGINQLGGSLEIDPGFPISSGQFMFGTNAGYLFIAQDDMGADVFGGELGFSQQAIVGLVSVADTKTVDSLNFYIGGASIPDVSVEPGFTDGGTLNNVCIFKALGLLPQGGSLLINNAYAYRVSPFFGFTPATNSWGLSVGADVENFMQKSLAIATTDEKVYGDSLLGLGDQASISGDIHSNIRNVRLKTDPTGYAVDAAYAALTSATFTDDSSTAIVGFHNTTKVNVTGTKTIGGMAGIFNTLSRAESGDDGSVPFAFGVLSNFASGNGTTKNTGTYAAYFAGFHSIDSSPDQITSMYDFYAQSSSIGASGVTTRYGIVIEADSGYTKQNWLSGKTLIGNSSFSTPQVAMDIDDDSLIVRTAKTVTNSTDPGITGQIAWDANYIYVCIATDTWVRSPLATW